MAVDELRLRDYRPRSRLRVPVHDVRCPRFPVVDAHNHLASLSADEPGISSSAELLDRLDASGVETLVDLDGGQGDRLAAEIERWETARPGRVVVFAGLDYDRWATDDAFGETEAAALRDSVNRGARGLKVWKQLGLRARDPNGRLVAIYDPRLDPLWATAADLALPVVIHIADPIAFFEPLDPTNERIEELRENPDWHFYPTRPKGDLSHPDFPSFDEIMEQFESLLRRHPGTDFIGAHVGCYAENLGWVGRVMDACPNFYADISARIAELGRQPYTARGFFVAHQDRILFGTDSQPDPQTYAIYYRFLETRDEYFNYGREQPPGVGRWQIYGLDLPDDVLRKVYADNAKRVIFDRQ